MWLLWHFYWLLFSHQVQPLLQGSGRAAMSLALCNSKMRDARIKMGEPAAECRALTIFEACRDDEKTDDSAEPPSEGKGSASHQQDKHSIFNTSSQPKLHSLISPIPKP